MQNYTVIDIIRLHIHVAAQWLISYEASYTYRINHSASVILAVVGGSQW